MELEVSESLRSTGYQFSREYPLGPFVYDFAFTALHLIIEIDGRSYHWSEQRKRRDRAKTRYASELGWKLVRIPSGPKCALLAEKAVLDREQELA